jgi:uncharacterized protein (TIGR02444 family)
LIMSDPPGASGGTVHLDPNAFWEFSLHVYGDPIVRTSCLALQDEAGADVNVILLLLYAATRRVALTSVEVARIDGSCAKWRETVIRPLRGARRAAASAAIVSAADACSALKSAELMAEKVAQEMLVQEFNASSLSTGMRAALELAADNLEAYQACVPMSTAVVGALLAAFAEVLLAEPSGCRSEHR